MEQVTPVRGLCSGRISRLAGRSLGSAPSLNDVGGRVTGQRTRVSVRNAEGDRAGWGDWKTSLTSGFAPSGSYATAAIRFIASGKR
jgi:hypothetical protein